jgi:hypothetical protein
MEQFLCDKTFYAVWIGYDKIMMNKKDIYATALDYDRTAKTIKQFFAKVQNKMHYTPCSKCF